MKVLLVVCLASATGEWSAPRLWATPESGNSALVPRVEQRFETAPGVPATFIEVGATNGVVTLTGAVDNLLARNRAGAVAQTVPGVSAVHNRLVVLPSDRSDWELRAGVASALTSAPALMEDRIYPRVNAGYVTLTGTVASWPERRLAGLLTEGVDGVRGVDNKLDVAYGTARSDAEIKADVMSQLKWDAWLDAPEQFKVRVEDGQVLVTGLVDSASAQQRVYKDGWVNGVQYVDVSGVQVVPNVRLAMKESGLEGGPGATARGRMTELQMQRDIAGACHLDPLLKPGHVEVQVQRGFVILQGAVPSPDARQAAEEIAREVAGPGQVENLLKIEPVEGS